MFRCEETRTVLPGSSRGEPDLVVSLITTRIAAMAITKATIPASNMMMLRAAGFIFKGMFLVWKCAEFQWKLSNRACSTESGEMRLVARADKAQMDASCLLHEHDALTGSDAMKQCCQHW